MSDHPRMILGLIKYTIHCNPGKLNSFSITLCPDHCRRLPNRISVALSFVVRCPGNSSPPPRTGCPSRRSRWSVSLRSTCSSPRIPVASPYSPCYHSWWRVLSCCSSTSSGRWVQSRAASSWGHCSRWAPTWISSLWSPRWSPTSSPWKINRTNVYTTKNGDLLPFSWTSTYQCFTLSTACITRLISSLALLRVSARTERDMFTQSCELFWGANENGIWKQPSWEGVRLIWHL